MLSAAVWVAGAAVAAGLGLSCFYLLERPIRGAARLASWGHGLVGAVSVGLVFAGVWAMPGDPEGLGWFSAGALGMALLAGLAILAMQLRGRRPAGLVVALHATLAIAGYVILLSFSSLKM